MRKIMTINDIEEARFEELLPDTLLDHLELSLINLFGQLSEGEALEVFSLEQHGYYVVLEPEDDVRDLSETGLSKGDGGLLGATPEWVELKQMDDGLMYYEVAIIFNNEYCQMYYLQQGMFDEEVEQWLRENAGEE